MADEIPRTQHILDVSARFSELVLKAGGPTKVARALGASRTTIDNWAAGVSRIPLEAAAKVSVMAGRSLDWLAGIDQCESQPISTPSSDPLSGLPDPSDREAFVSALVERGLIRPVDTGARGREGFVPVPLLQVSASAGRGRFTVPDDILGGDMVLFREVWLRSLGLTPGRVHILWAVGDSMMPTIRDGDMLLVDRMIEQVRDDGIYVVVVGGGVLVKRVQLRHNGSVVLRSDNERYPEETIPPDQVPELIVEGRVRWVGGPI